MSLPASSAFAAPVRLLDQVRQRIRYMHYSLRTEQAYVHWVRAFVRFRGLRHPKTMGRVEVEAFLSWLSSERQVSVSTHRQVLLVDEVRRVLALLEGTHAVLARLLYSTGMRIFEALQFRVKDVDVEHQAIIARAGKGGKARVVMLPVALAADLRTQLARARLLWQADTVAGTAGVAMPDALERKYPQAGRTWAWFWVFPQAVHSTCPRSGIVRRHHVYDQTFQRDFKRAVTLAALHLKPHPLRQRQCT